MLVLVVYSDIPNCGLVYYGTFRGLGQTLRELLGLGLSSDLLVHLAALSGKRWDADIKVDIDTEHIATCAPGGYAWNTAGWNHDTCFGDFFECRL